MAKNKDLDTELNLIAFISLLSVLICSLLLTAIWVQIGSMNVKQAVGGQAAEEDSKKNPVIWIQVQADKALRFELQDVPRVARKLNKKNIPPREGELDVVAYENYVQQLKRLVPDLRTALIQPKAETLYEDIVKVMDYSKKAGLIDLGVSPL